jgi:hypothetical protein
MVSSQLRRDLHLRDKFSEIRIGEAAKGNATAVGKERRSRGNPSYAVARCPGDREGRSFFVLVLR